MAPSFKRRTVRTARLPRRQRPNSTGYIANQTFFGRVNSRIPSRPPILPNPLLFTPPNGIAGGIPKSASAANAQGKACAAVIMNMMSGKSTDMPRLNGACYNTVAPGYAFSLSGIYQPREGQFAEVEGSTSPVDAPREVRQREAESAINWFKTITVDAFG